MASVTSSGKIWAAGAVRPTLDGDTQGGSGSESSSAARVVSAIAARSSPVHDPPGDVTWRHAAACAAIRSGLIVKSIIVMSHGPRSNNERPTNRLMVTLTVALTRTTQASANHGAVQAHVSSSPRRTANPTMRRRGSATNLLAHGQVGTRDATVLHNTLR